MKTLLIADREDIGLWDYWHPSKTEGIDLIISCGDLDPAYLEFLVTVTNKPLLYVRGNHDAKYDKKPPLGCVCIENEVYNFKGLRILGLGGSYRYGNAPDMYTERQMEKRIRKMAGTLLFTNGFDILVTHAPAMGYGDLSDLPHRGFDCFNDLLDKYHPPYMLHGHVHEEYGDFQRERKHPSGTRIINACGRHILDISEDEYPKEGNTGSFFYDWYITQKNRH